MKLRTVQSIAWLIIAAAVFSVVLLAGHAQAAVPVYRIGGMCWVVAQPSWSADGTPWVWLVGADDSRRLLRAPLADLTERCAP